MATTITEPATISTAEDLWYLWPHQVDWDFYRKVLRLRGEQGIPRLLFLNGSLYFMTPSQLHEELKQRLGRFVEEVAIGLQIHYKSTGSTTWKRRAEEAGVEGDLTYYIAQEPQVRGKKTIHLRRDPPPDLAIEVVYKHGVTEALEVYRRLRVPEVWVSMEQGFEILHLSRTSRGYRYISAERSLAFPFLSAAEIADWIGKPSESDLQWAIDLRRWVLETLAPRVARERADS